jgi:hypothetical protein
VTKGGSIGSFEGQELVGSSGEKVLGAAAPDKDAPGGLEGSEGYLIAAWYRDIIIAKGQ